MCSLVINGVPHGGHRGTATCQLHMRHFKDGETITIEPWRAKAFPLIRDLATDRAAFDRIIQAGGFVSINTGGTPDGNALPISKEDADLSMDAAACIGCGACVAACKNASAMLFRFRQGLAPQPAALRVSRERRRVLAMVRPEGRRRLRALAPSPVPARAVCPKGNQPQFHCSA
jgi:succinate dehydrogenase / fumarate reductase iron-sulfur subunit